MYTLRYLKKIITIVKLRFMKRKIFSSVLIFILHFHFVLSQTLIPYRSGELWGYCTPDKKIVIAPKYEHAEWFSDGLAAVAYGCDEDCYDVYDGKWTYIDEKGNQVLPHTYDLAYPFNKGSAWVQIDGFWQKINKKGEVLFKDSEKTCKRCLPKELVGMNDESSPITDEFKAKYRWDGRNRGYYNSNKGIEYWDDPEAVFFVPIINLAELKNSGVPLMVSNTYHYFTHRQGIKLKPSVVFLTYDKSEIKAEKTFPLGEAVFTKEKDEADYYIEKEYVKFNIPDFEKIKPYIERAKQNPNQEKLMVAISVKIPTETLRENVFFNIISKGIDFQTLEDGYTLFGYYSSMYEMTKPSWQKDCLASMVKEIRKVGAAMNEQKDGQNRLIQGKDNPYRGKMLFDVMEQATENDVMEFLKYVSVKPFIYMGQEHKLAEVFATWVDSGAPRVVSKE